MSEEERPPASSGAEAAPITVAAVNLKLPPFWPADPEVWFSQVEAQFSTRGITSRQTRYDYVVASLSLAFASEVRDLILTVPDRPYETLKRALIDCNPHRRNDDYTGSCIRLSWAIASRRNFSDICASSLGTPSPPRTHPSSESSSSNDCRPQCAWSWDLVPFLTTWKRLPSRLTEFLMWHHPLWQRQLRPTQPQMRSTLFGQRSTD